MEREKKREYEKHRKEHQAWPSELRHFSEPSLLAHLGATRTPHGPQRPTLALYLSRNLISSCRGALPTLPGHLCPGGHSPCPGLAPLPALSADKQGEGGPGEGHCGLAAQGTTSHGHPTDDPEAAVGSHGARAGSSLGPHCSSVCLWAGKGVWPPPLPYASPPAHLWRDPVVWTPHHRGLTHPTGAEMDKTYVNGREQVIWAPWLQRGAGKPLSGRGATSPGLSAPGSL